MPHSQGFSNNPSPEPKQPNSGIDTYLFNQSNAYDLISRHAVAVMHSGQ